MSSNAVDGDRTIPLFVEGITREVDPADFTPWDLRVWIAQERAGGWEPEHYVPPGGDQPVCQRHAGHDPSETYGFTSNRDIWERWYQAGWGCQPCAEVLHS